MSIEIQQLIPALEPAYEKFLLDDTRTTLYYSLRYRSFLEDLLGCRSRYLIAVQDTDVVGILPLMEIEGRFGRVLNSLPFFGSNGGIVARSDSARRLLGEAYEALASESDVASSVYIENPLIDSDGSALRHDLTDERIGQLSELRAEGSREPGFPVALDASAHRNIRKAASLGVCVSVDCNAVDFLQRVHQESMAEMGGQMKSNAFFEKVSLHFRADEDFRIYVAKRDGESVAALLLFYFNDTVEYFIPATLKKHRSLQPMAAILAQAMRDASEAGFRMWNWGGTWLSQEGVWRFKKKWGAKEYPYRYYITLNRSHLLERRREDLSAEYPGFYVVPFHLLAHSA